MLCGLQQPNQVKNASRDSFLFGKISVITLSEVVFVGLVLVQGSDHHWDRAKVSEYRIKTMSILFSLLSIY